MFNPKLPFMGTRKRRWLSGIKENALKRKNEVEDL